MVYIFPESILYTTKEKYITNSEEKIIAELSKANLILTDYKIVHVETKWDALKYTSIMLEQISAIEVKYYSRPLLLLATVVLVILSIYLFAEEHEDVGGTLALISAFVLFVLFLLFRKSFLVIY